MLKKFDTEEAWLQERNNNICGTEVAVLFGKGDFMSLDKLWIKKFSKEVGAPIENANLERGNFFELPIALLGEKVYGYKLDRESQHNFYTYDGDHRLASTIDFLAQDQEGKFILEVKTMAYKKFQSLFGKGSITSETITFQYWAQLQAQMICSGIDRSKILIDTGFGYPKLSENIRLDLITEGDILKKVDDFWISIKNKTPPMINEKESEQKVSSPPTPKKANDKTIFKGDNAEYINNLCTKYKDIEQELLTILEECGDKIITDRYSLKLLKSGIKVS